MNAPRTAVDYDAAIGSISIQLEAARMKVSELETELAYWREGKERFSSANRGATSSGKPTLVDSILSVLGESDEALPTQVIVEELQLRGWMPNGESAEHNVRSKLAQLARGDDPKLEREGRGVYKLAEPLSAGGP